MGVQQSVIAPEKVVEGSNAAKAEKPSEKEGQKGHGHRAKGDIAVSLPPLHRSLSLQTRRIWSSDTQLSLSLIGW